ncbi:Ndc1p Ecym_4109 [Eremothecium cymbalariae DBVPG|uniref:Nucleoporin NDC1 n=1 Tax=Eremothecium cymbalariae (strain CBS 270.75 / DBVPG 7215 / KCTC 17166 / NRRL Y-17582) TaxID=931890 RepID=G8JT35_ERECY|nr:hypothetical protein Ecym_4109 [Eremothecium cymbalariae DBVPG\
MYASSVPAPLNSRYSYHAIFSDICKTRFNHLAVRLLLTLTIIVGTILTVLSRWETTAWERFLLIPIKTVLLYVALLLVIITRKNYLHVQFLGYTNMISFIYGEFCSAKFLLHLVTYIASGMLISWTLNGVVYDTWYYVSPVYQRLNVWFLNPVFFAVQQLSFDLGRLSFTYGYKHQSHQSFISSRLYDSFIKCGILTIIVFVVQPFCYFALTSRLSAGFLAHLQCSLISFITFQLWDLTNIAFNAYLSIGCLHKGKPISSLSSTPMETLVTGLSSKRLFTRLTAFQELSYRATSPDVQLRIPIYHTRYGNSHIWSNILRECLLTIQESNTSITTFLKTLEAHSKENSSQSKQRLLSPLSQDDILFGNRPAATTLSGSQMHTAGSAPISADEFSRRINLDNNNLYLNRHSALQFNHPSQSYNPPIFTQQTNLLNIVQDVVSYFAKMVSSFFFPSQTDSSNAIRPLSFFELWTISRKRQAEKLIPLPSCYAECVIALMGMLINSLDEDPKGSVVSSVGEVLKILERCVGSLGAFVEWEAPERHVSSDAISILYDLAINAFLEIVLKYNELLNDVYLDDDVVKLSQWVLQIFNE